MVDKPRFSKPPAGVPFKPPADPALQQLGKTGPPKPAKLPKAPAAPKRHGGGGGVSRRTSYDSIAKPPQVRRVSKPRVVIDPKKRALIAPESGEFDTNVFDPDMEVYVEGRDDVETGDGGDDDGGGGIPRPISNENELGPMAPITVVPTSSSNPARPRTLAAGYARERKTLSVIFRDGTPWNYYEVTALEWANFKRAKSKGRFIRLYLNQHPYGPPTDQGGLEGQSSFRG
jgi:hypothetical protein